VRSVIQECYCSLRVDKRHPASHVMQECDCSLRVDKNYDLNAFLNNVLQYCACFYFYVMQLSYAVMSKELKHCRHLEDLEVNENVKGKARNYVVKYMSRFPGMYRASNYSP